MNGLFKNEPDRDLPFSKDPKAINRVLQIILLIFLSKPFPGKDTWGLK